MTEDRLLDLAKLQRIVSGAIRVANAAHDGRADTGSIAKRVACALRAHLIHGSDKLIDETSRSRIEILEKELAAAQSRVITQAKSIKHFLKKLADAGIEP